MTGSTFTCPRCHREMPWIVENIDPFTDVCRECGGAAATTALAASTATRHAEGGSGVVLTVIGLAFLAAGLYFLVLNPGVAVDRSGAGALASLVPDRVANLQRLAMGETFSIVGAIFLAAAWRPR